jgi:outer membrane lipopolysaccharide assembly protein LptE/RlpB
MTRLFLFLLMMGFATACGKDEKPENLIPQQKMERVIWDMVQADEFITNFVLKDSAKVNVNVERYKLYDKVMSLHSITKQQFEDSYNYYASRPKENKLLFDSLAARANRRIQESYESTDMKPQ